MDIELLRKQFGRVGARVQITEVGGRARAGIDIRTDRLGEFFDIRLSLSAPVSYEVVDLQPQLRHLLLLARRADSGKEKYLCGHDERHWFVCGVPERESVVNVVGAMRALQPPEVRALAARELRRASEGLRRHNAAFVRQGEWFFVPSPELLVNAALVFRNEPISRGNGSKPHLCQFLYRQGGVVVMVSRRHPTGVPLDRYRMIITANPEAAHWNWRSMRRDAETYVRGRISHPDHKTVVLDGWHRVLMNTENEAPGREHVVFLD